MKVSFVVPVFNERETLEGLVEGILEHATPHEAQIVLVDDGSDDGSSGVMDELARKHPSIEVVRLGRNLGKSAALAAGFACAKGDLVFTMDADLQDDPKEIPLFLEKIGEGFDLVCGWKAVRHDPWHKTFPSRVYNRFVAWLFGLPLNDVNCGYKLMRREVVKSLRLFGDMHRLIPVLAAEQGFRVGEVAVEHQPRRCGRSKYGIERFARGAIDVMTLWFLTRYGQRPAHFLVKWGAVGVLAGVLLILAGNAVSSVAPEAIGAGVLAGGAAWMGLGLLAELIIRGRDWNGPQQDQS